MGTVLRAQAAFDDLFHRPDIATIKGREYGLVVCAGAPAQKWKADREPEPDLANLRVLMSHLERVRAERFLLLSTVDVYGRLPVGVDERTPPDSARCGPYGRHRLLLEEFVRQHFPGGVVVRLPGLFGDGLRKNFLYDLLHNNCLHLTHRDSVFQYYDLGRLWTDLQRALELRLPTVNFATEPVRAGEVAARAFGVAFDNVTENPPVRYDMRTVHAADFGGSGAYLYSAEETFDRIRRFVARAQGQPA